MIGQLVTKADVPYVIDASEHHFTKVFIAKSCKSHDKNIRSPGVCTKLFIVCDVLGRNWQQNNRKWTAVFKIIFAWLLLLRPVVVVSDGDRYHLVSFSFFMRVEIEGA